jgi:hypothetical protein
MPHERYLVGELLGFDYGQDEGNHPLIVCKSLKSAIKYVKWLMKPYIKGEENHLVIESDGKLFQIYDKKTKEYDEEYACYIEKIDYFSHRVPKKEYRGVCF